MPNRLQHLRYQAYQQQNGNCYYCEMQMWNNSPEELATQYRLSTSRVKPLKCTAEHLEARQDGGKDSKTNIVAACLFCNSHRHKTKKPKDPMQFKEKVKLRMARQGWTSQLIPK